MENNLKVSNVIDNLIDSEDYKDARVLVFDENNKLIVSEELVYILFSTYKLLAKYELVKWSTDYFVGQNKKINTLIIFAKSL